MPSEDEIQTWSKAVDQFIAASLHLKAHLGKPGEALAKRDYEAARIALDEAAAKLG